MKPVAKINPEYEKLFQEIIYKIDLKWAKKLRKFQYWQM
jgi:hypothetical protein